MRVVLFSPRSVCDAHVAEEVMACVHVGGQKSKPSRWHGGATSGTALLESRHYYERVLSCFLTVNPQIEHYIMDTVTLLF
jgi:hypothetical protein